ncbi:PQQ-binding-like beta-propeller repeat protein [Nocardia sp. NPDC058658]|uniref:outer membrane protein assembly factor BamB family protein n=1 Tax=Nocardia sp. NPDC058658 TaxID=3346580 RepID=UPI00365686EE
MNTSLPRLPDYSRVANVAAITGTAVLLGGVGLGIYSRFIAAPNPVAPQDDGLAALPDALGMSAIVVGVMALLVVAVALTWARRLQRAGFGNPGVAIYLVLAVAVVRTLQLHIPSTTKLIADQYAAFPRLPTAVAAWILVCLGILIVSYPLSVAPQFTLKTRGFAVPALIALLVCALTAGVAAWFGNDNRFFEHRPATSVVAAPIPNRLGQERFRIDLPEENRVVVGGPGFIVGTATGITAYDGATGAPRWHYLRPGATEDSVHHSYTELLSIPSENVVVTDWASLGLIAFDATTGRKLWTDSEFVDDVRDGVRAAKRFDSTTAPMLAWADNDYASHKYGNFRRYDARTGRLLWTVPPVPEMCRKEVSKIAITSRAVYQVLVCHRDQSAWTTIHAFDPATGAQIAQRDLPNPEPDREPRLSVNSDVVSIDWPYRTEPLDRLIITSPAQLSTAATTADTGQVIAADPSTDTVASYSWSTGVTLSEGRIPTQPRVLPDSIPLDVNSSNSALLADEFVAVGPERLHTWRRDDLTGRSTPVPTAPTKSSQIIAAPGIILIATSDKAGSDQLIGFAPR